ncbi:hypothetical protein D3C85_1445510 [compost metagenome]
MQHLAHVIIRQAALLLRQPRLLERQAVSTLDLFGQLPPSEQLFAGVDDPSIEQHAQGGHSRTDVDHRHQTLFRRSQLTGQQTE